MLLPGFIFTNCEVVFKIAKNSFHYNLIELKGSEVFILATSVYETVMGYF